MASAAPTSTSTGRRASSGYRTIAWNGPGGGPPLVVAYWRSGVTVATSGILIHGSGYRTQAGRLGAPALTTRQETARSLRRGASSDLVYPTWHAAMHVAYLASRYPDVSHTFIQREIVALRRLGVEISTFTVRRARPDQTLSALDREEAAGTYSILPPRLGDHLGAHRRALGRGYLACLVRSLRRAPGGARALLWRLFYFA